MDTSALIDGRVADLVATGFVGGTILLHEGVLRELQAISDSSDPHRRSRGRRGLDVLVELQKAPTVQFQLVEEAGVHRRRRRARAPRARARRAAHHRRPQHGEGRRGAPRAGRADQRARHAVPRAVHRR